MEHSEVSRKPCVFLDRDGTIALEVPYCASVEEFRFLPRAADAVAMLNRHGFLVVVVTNQSGIARGLFNEKELQHVHDFMLRALADQGAKIDAVYHCPHHPDDHCACRKPAPGMLVRASRELAIALEDSYLIGDSMSDMEAAQSVGCTGVLVGMATVVPADVPGVIQKSDVYEAAQWILNEVGYGD